MFESYFFKAEKENSIVKIFLLTFFITISLGMLNFFIGKDFLFLVALVSVVLTYPVVSYIQNMNTQEISKQFRFKKLIFRHDKELIVFWTIFVSMTLVFVLLLKLNIITSYPYQESFMSSINGDITNSNIGFAKILINNITVAFITFLLCFISFSGLIFVLTWNSSILSYHIFNIGNKGFFNLPHGLLEVGGYVMAGILGTFMAYTLTNHKDVEKFKTQKEIVRDLIILFTMSISLLILGAFAEVL